MLVRESPHSFPATRAFALVGTLLLASLVAGSPDAAAGTFEGIHSGPAPDDLVVRTGEVHVVNVDCDRDRAVLEAAGAIRIQGTVTVQRNDPCVPSTLAGPSLVLEATVVHLAETGTIHTSDGADGDGTHVTWTTVAGRDRKFVRGADGGPGGDLVVRATTFVAEGAIHLGSGGDGADAVAKTTAADVRTQGGNGGRSGRLFVDAANLRGAPALLGGAGGDGGDAEAQAGGNGSAYQPGADDHDRGDNGTDYVDPDGQAAHATAWDGQGVDADGDGAPGGRAGAFGGHGGDGTIRGGHGGNATAQGGDGVDGVQVPDLHGAGDGGHGGSAKAKAGDGGNVVAAGYLVGAGPYPGPPVFVGGPGGTASAIAGDGGDGGDADPVNGSTGPVRGGDGGRPGLAFSIAGDAGGGMLGGGAGGNSWAVSGDGGDGGNATGPRSVGGDGHDARSTWAVGGRGGWTTLGPGGDGGDIFAIGGDAGDGGSGTGRNGQGGDVGRMHALPGEGGRGSPDGEGGQVRTERQGQDGQGGGEAGSATAEDGGGTRVIPSSIPDRPSPSGRTIPGPKGVGAAVALAAAVRLLRRR